MFGSWKIIFLKPGPLEQFTIPLEGHGNKTAPSREIQVACSHTAKHPWPPPSGFRHSFATTRNGLNSTQVAELAFMGPPSPPSFPSATQKAAPGHPTKDEPATLQKKRPRSTGPPKSKPVPRCVARPTVAKLSPARGPTKGRRTCACSQALGFAKVESCNGDLGCNSPRRDIFFSASMKHYYLTLVSPLPHVLLVQKATPEHENGMPQNPVLFYMFYFLGNKKKADDSAGA